MNDSNSKDRLVLLCGVLLVAMSMFGIHVEIPHSGWVMFMGLLLCFSAA